MKRFFNWIRAQFDKSALILGLRAVGAILLANTLVVPILTNGQNPYWWILLITGSILLIFTSLKAGDK